MNINPYVVRIKAAVQEASQQNFRIECPDKKKRVKVARDDKCSSALEMVVPIGEAEIRGGFVLNMEAHRSRMTSIEKYRFL
jgi:hypothetical protein